MKPRKPRSAAFAAFALAMGTAAGAPAMAGQWVICDYTIRTTAHHARQQQIEARVEAVAAAHPANTADCLPVGATLRFAPESADYQQMLPRRAWPRVHQRARLQYRHLDGICKNDGNPRPCRITHHAILKTLQDAP